MAQGIIVFYTKDNVQMGGCSEARLGKLGVPLSDFFGRTGSITNNKGIAPSLLARSRLAQRAGIWRAQVTPIVLFSEERMVKGLHWCDASGWVNGEHASH